MNEDSPVVFVVDDDLSICTSLKRLFKSVGLQCESFASAREFLQATRPDAPSCLVLDVRMPGMSGLDLQRELTEAQAQIPIIFLTSHGDIPMTVRAMKAGAFEFLTKPFHDQDLLDAVHHAIELDRAARRLRAEITELHKHYDTLTPREREVMALVVAGLLNKQIAAHLGAGEKTIKAHRGQVMRKMKAQSLAELVRMADKLGIHPPSA